MVKDINWVLNTLNINIQQLTDIINQTGGRDPERPIIYAEKCHNRECGATFFSNTQDHMMRRANGYPDLCPGCREVDRKEKKRKYAKGRTRTTAWLD